MSGRRSRPRDGITAHYGRAGELSGHILRLAREERAASDALLQTSDLAPFDQFHTGGSQSTARLAELARPAAGDLVLDIGAGIAGPARQLAQEQQVTVVALDLTEVFCRTASLLSHALGLGQMVLACCADATRLPFPDQAFDLVWTQHAAMNIADKAALYREAARVLREDGQLALHDITAGPAGPPRYPVPWAKSAADSWLLPPEEVRSLVTSSGLREVFWQDYSESHLAEQRAKRKQQGKAAPPPGPHLLYPGFRELARNLRHSLEERRARVVIGLFRKNAS